MSKEKRSKFENAGEAKNFGVVGELFAMLKQNKKYWLLPILLALLLVGALILLGGTSAAPFIYNLF